MSLTGITFANQKITPSDDGRLYGAMLADGILTGCGITFAAATLSVAAGSLLIGTRELRTSGETLSVTGATSGYARVIIDIDLTRAATKTSFEQAQFKIQYAASLDAFAALEQQDINTAGTHYQAAFCVLSLSTAGITGVVSSLASARVGTAQIGNGVVTLEKLADSARGNASSDLSATPFSAGNNGRLLIFSSSENTSYTLTQSLWNSLPAGFSVTIVKGNGATSGALTINWTSMAGVWDFTRGTVFYNETESLTLVRRGDTVTFEKWSGTNRLLISGNFNTPNFFAGTSDTPPSIWQPGDFYLKYE